ncbi:SDR family NAD(P)-dependent oxidoreductase [Klebsiella pneumoniae]
MARVVVITGGGTGIGAACARLMRAAGDRVFITGRREAPLQAVANETGATALVGDAADGEVWRQRLLPAILDQTGGIDVLICSAGGVGHHPPPPDTRPPAETSDRQWREALDGNLTSAFASVRACLPSLIARRGNVLFVASIASLAAGPQACGYVTAKHALIGLMRSVARDYGPQGVRANAVCPGWVTTPMADEEMHPLMQAEGLSLTEAYQRVCRDVPLRRPASPEEIAEACQFLCSPQAAIISGATLVADGGASIVDVPTLAFA